MPIMRNIHARPERLPARFSKRKKFSPHCWIGPAFEPGPKAECRAGHSGSDRPTTNLLSPKFVSSSRTSRNETGDYFYLAAPSLRPPPRCAARHAAALPDAAETFSKAERAAAGDRARAGNTATTEWQNSKQSRADYGHRSRAR